MTDLIDFLHARLDEDGGDNRVHDLDCNLSLSDGFRGPCDCGWDDRMLREVEAKRCILDLSDQAVDYPPYRDDYTAAHALDDAFKLLASAYSDHPDYRPEWAVTP